MDTYTTREGAVVSLDRPAVPWVQSEDIVLTANENNKLSSPSLWNNGSDDLLLIDYITFDMNSLNYLVRFGVAGRVPVIKDYVAPAVLENVLKMNRAQDNSYPTLLLREEYPYVIPPRDRVTVLLKDTLSGGDRDINVVMSGLNQDDVYTYISNRETVPSGGSIGVVLESKENGPMRVWHFQLYEESVGSAGDLAGLEVWVKGAGQRQWSQAYIRGSLHFPNRNGDGLAYRPPVPLILEPGDILDFEFLDRGMAGGTMYLGTIGYTFDLRA